MKRGKSRNKHKPRSKPWFGKEDQKTTPLREALGKTYGQNPLERDDFGRREALAREIERALRGKER